QQYALNLSCVERIVRAVEITPLPDAPDVVLGVINVEGRVIPVLNTRKRLGLPEKELELLDLFIIVSENDRTFALIADQVRPVLEVPAQEVVSPDRVLPGTGYVQSVAKLAEGMLVVLTVERTLSFSDQTKVFAAIEEISGHPNV
ncbi:MAG: purine-binding chemotaxis protein CheW, partial [Desulfomonile tiedjei]|nr:purine-binding chemotaxis protein CheW [Desulfomonile tiedjei]